MKHVNDQNIGSETFQVYSPIHLSATKLSFDGKVKSMLDMAAAKFNTTKIRLVSQHNHNSEGNME